MHHDGHCGCGHDHSHTHTHDCGCGHEHGPAQGELTPAMEDFLHHLHHHRFLPVARFLVESSVEEDFCAVALAPVYLRAPDESMESVKETAAMLLELEKMRF